MTPPERVVPGRPPPWGPAGVCRADDLLASPRTRAGRAGGSVPGRGWHHHRVRPPPRFAHAGLRAGDPAPGRRPSFLTLVSFQAAASGARRGLGILGGFAWGVWAAAGRRRRDGSDAENEPSGARRCAPGARQVRAGSAGGRQGSDFRGLLSPAHLVAEAPHASRAGSGERGAGVGAPPRPPRACGQAGGAGRTARRGPGRGHGGARAPPHATQRPGPAEAAEARVATLTSRPLSRREGDARDAHVRTESASVRRHLVTWGATCPRARGSSEGRRAARRAVGGSFSPPRARARTANGAAPSARPAWTARTQTQRRGPPRKGDGDRIRNASRREGGT